MSESRVNSQYAAIAIETVEKAQRMTRGRDRGGTTATEEHGVKNKSLSLIHHKIA